MSSVLFFMPVGIVSEHNVLNYLCVCVFFFFLSEHNSSYCWFFLDFLFVVSGAL